MNFYYATSIVIKEVVVSTKWLLGISLMLSTVAQANENSNQDTDISIPSPWKHQVEFGYQAHSGNTESESLNSRLKSEYTMVVTVLMGSGSFISLIKMAKKINASPPSPSKATINSDRRRIYTAAFTALTRVTPLISKTIPYQEGSVINSHTPMRWF